MLIQKLSTAAATAALIGAMLAPVAHASTEITVNGNGADSTNKVTVSNTNENVVGQSTVTNVTNTITSSANTGGNNANNNTGGNVSIETGDAKSKVNVHVTGGSNTAAMPEPCGCDADLTVDVKNNGADSTNKVKVTTSNISALMQEAKTKVKNTISTKAKTGKNKANGNTNGTVSVVTGGSTSTVDVTVAGGSNSAL